MSFIYLQDYPDVTHVVQVGSTARAQYIHRLGRTARAGKDGSGTLLLFDYEEEAMLKELSDMPLTKKEITLAELQTHRVHVEPVLAMVQEGKLPAINSLASSAYAAYFGFYMNGWSRKFNMDKQTLVGKAHEFSRALGLTTTPPLSKKAVGMLGLKGLQGIVVEDVVAVKKRKGVNYKNAKKSTDKKT